MTSTCMIAYTFYETDNRVRRYAETLARHGHRVDAIVLRREGQKSHEIIQGVHVHRIQRRTVTEKHPLSYLFKLLVFFILSAWTVSLRHLRARYHLIHVHSVPDFEVFAALIPKLMGARVLLDIHDIVPELYASKFRVSQSSPVFRLLLLVEKLSCLFADHVIVANHIWHERLITRVGLPDHFTTILNYPDTSIFSQRHTTPKTTTEFVVFYPGTLSRHQGVDLLITAIAKIQNEIPNIRLLIIGDGAERESLITMASRHAIEDRVTIRGGMPIEQIAAMMATVDLGVEPKRKRSFANEALSTKILEFMAMGVPVLASDTTVHQLYFQGGLVEFFDSENADDLAAKILDLSRDAAKRSAFREKGRQFITTNNWEVKKYEYLKLVEASVL